MKPTIRKATGILVMAIVLTGCAADKAKDLKDASGKATAEEGYAMGKVVDRQGNPIAGAKIHLDNAAFYDAYIDGITEKDGSYKIKVYEGAWKAYASFKTEYNGRVYALQLFPEDPASFTIEGGVRNFTWKLEGVDPDNEYYFYGGRVTVHAANDFYEDESDIELTFKPSGPLIDGSAGKTLTLRYGEHYWEKYGYIEDIPIGRYKVTAVLKGDTGDVPLKIQNWYTNGDFVPEFQLDFIPDNSDFRPTTEASIVIGY